MAVNLLERRSLAQAVDLIARETPQMFLERTFFPAAPEDHLTRVVDIEILRGTSGLAVYTKPTEQSRMVQTTANAVKHFPLPITNEHKFFLSEDLYLNGGLGNGAIYVNNAADLTANRNAKITRALTELINRVRRRREEKVAQALTTGKVSYKGKSTEFELDFGFTADHRSTVDWSSAGDPLGALRAAKRAVQKRTGVSPTIVVMGSAAAAAFLAHADVKAVLDGNNYRAGTIDLTGTPDGGGDFLGTILGMRVYEYTQSFTDNGVTTEMWPEDLVVVGAVSADRRIHRGPIFWEKEGIQTGQEVYSRQLEVENPDGRKIQVASSSLPIIHDPDTIQLLTVTTS